MTGQPQHIGHQDRPKTAAAATFQISSIYGIWMMLGDDVVIAFLRLQLPPASERLKEHSPSVVTSPLYDDLDWCRRAADMVLHSFLPPAPGARRLGLRHWYARNRPSHIRDDLAVVLGSQGTVVPFQGIELPSSGAPAGARCDARRRRSRCGHR